MNKILKATYRSPKDRPLVIGKLEIPCFVLEDGTRVLSGSEMLRVLGFNPGKIGGSLERAISNKLIKSILPEKANSILTRIKSEKKYFQTGIGGFADNAIGYDATLLIDIADLCLEAKNIKEFAERMELHIASAETLMRSVAKVGIIALVDEATGYQYEREKYELQAILQAYISEEILEWQRTFELSFYKEIFRLWNIPFTAQNIKRKPIFIGKLTNELVYKNMPKGIFVLDRLKTKTPKTEGGNYKYRLHQSLTPEAGREALKKVIYSVEALASISDTKAKFLN